MKAERLKLMEIELQSSLWGRLEEHLNTRLATLRKKNDADLDEKRTARLRGRIQEVNAMLALATGKPFEDTEE